jgi:hypothetical protein
MAVTEVQNVLRRALFEPDFHSLLLADPQSALAPYTLSAEERDAIVNPGQMLYSYIMPGADARHRSDIVRAQEPPIGPPAPPEPPAPPPPPPEPPTTTTVIVVIAVIAIIAFALTVSNPTALTAEVEERFRPHVWRIAEARGPERSALVRELIGELTSEI